MLPYMSATLNWCIELSTEVWEFSVRVIIDNKVINVLFNITLQI
jgi:hypothetical protein